MRRIQRRRSAGWRMPPGAVYVGRPTKFGNPFPAGGPGGRAAAVEAYVRWLVEHPQLVAAARAELTGHDLACWCPLDGQPCHADVLIAVIIAAAR